MCVSFPNSLYQAKFEGTPVYLPDFERATMKDWWGQQLQELEENVLKQTRPDGYILTHNSPKLENASNCDFTGELAFAPLVEGQQNLLGNQTICPTAMHFNGQKHIKMHNDFGTSHAEAIRKMPLYTHSSSPGISGLSGFVIPG